MRPIILSILLLLISTFSHSQKAKNSDYVVSGATVLNAYTDVTANIAAGATNLTVTSNTLTNGPVLTTALAPGDLILIIQMQGASMDIVTTPAVPVASGGWGGNYTLSNSAMGDLANMGNYRKDWGTVTNYNNSGKYEYAEVFSVSGSTGITVQCALKNSYTATGHVQVVRVPRLNNLTLNASASVIPVAWNGASGGIVALEVNGTVSFGTNSKIVASGYGFRGGVTDNVSNGPGNASDVGKPAYSAASEGGEKGEGIGGAATATGDLTVTYYSRYGMGAAANGGGGGNYKNAGGGGGSNIGTGTYTGTGVLNPTYSAFYALEPLSANSSGGGRGGYSGAQNDQNEATVGPNNSAWQADSRRKEGGLGGHPLAYDATRVFMGGGGGAGEMDNNQGGSGGAGGGLVFLQSYGTITGTGVIEANGANGQNSNPLNQTAGIGAKRGVDGAGGAGAGGAIIISNGTAIPASITLNANGGNGGDNALNFGSFTSGVEADGPGGGGTGGFVNFTSGTPAVSTNGGNSGVVTIAGNLATNIVAGFTPNGATNGNSGSNLITQPFYNLIPNNASVCSGNPATLSVTVQGTLPSPITNANITWYTTYTGNTSVGTGLTFNIPSATATTTYYVGFCPNGTFRVPVTVTVGGPTIAGTAVVTNATCSAGGSITGLTTSGGAPTVTITWNGVTTPGMNLTNAAAGSYSVLVTDGIGCTATSGPYIIGTSGGPVINSTNMVVTNASCLGGGGSITGITATGTGLMYNWNSGAYSTLNITGLNAGNYNLVVTDNNGCTATLGPINVGQNSGPVVNTTNMVVTGTTCGLNNGSITGITATGTGLTYNWNTGAYSTLDITGLSSGNYNLVVTDNIGCTANAGPIAIGASSAPVINTASVSITHAHCNQSNGAISGLTVSGGQPGYTYNWNSGAYSTLNLSNIPAGTYTLQVTDNLGCITNAGPFTVNNIAGPVINTTNIVITNETCVGNDGAITGITATGTGTLTYNWNLVVSPTLDHTNIAGGTYGLLVSDAFGCNAIAGPFNVGLSPGPSINATNMVVAGTTCGLNNGSITGITASGTGLTYQWNGVTSATIDQSGLASGNYTLVVTDAASCTSTYGPIAIGASTAPVINSTSVSITHAHCNQSNGAISGLTVSGGQPGYTYNWNSGAYSTLNLSNIPAGIYTLQVTDNLGCIINAGPFTVNNIAGPVINTTNMVITGTTCGLSNGSITGITATGAGTLTYTWNSVVSPTLDHTNIPGGAYSLLVSDAFGCSATAGPFNVGSSAAPSINATNMVVTGTTCGLNNGSIIGITASGTGLTYQWNGVTSATIDQSGLASGNYTLVVTDAASCTSTYGPIAIGASTAPVINSTSVSITAAHCNQSNGAISGLSVSGGQPGYTYNWNSGAYNTLNLSNIPAGTYNLQVTDNLGCIVNAGPFTVNNIAGPTLNDVNVQTTAETCALNDGTISGLTATGTGLTYTWNGTVSPTLNQTNLSPGTYNVVVSDGFGCTVNGGPYMIGAVVPLSLNQNSLVITPTCTNTGAISGLQVVGGINPVVSWSNGPSTLNISNLTPGSYTITVTDDQNCSVQGTFAVTNTSTLAIGTNNAVVTNDNCANGSGSIFGITVSGGAPAYSYSWNSSPAQHTLNASNLTTGNYTLTVTDNAGCQATASFFVGVVPPPVIDQTAMVVTNESCLGNNGSITGIQVTGSGPFVYTWDGTPLTSLNLSNLNGGMYTLSVTDANGCVTSGAIVNVGSDPSPNADFSISNPVASPGEVITFTNTSSGGPFQDYSWTVSGVGLIGTGSSSTFNSMVEATYTMTLVVETVDGCIDSITKPFEILGEIKIPNIVTANGDHVNDEFYITNLKPNSKLVIQNRWGNVVFESDNYKNNWGGIDITGEKLDDGVYFYQLITADGKMWQGNVHLLID